MRLIPRIAIIAIIHVFIASPVNAQILDSLDYTGNSEIVVNDGLLSTDQVAAIGEGGYYVSLKDMPYNMTGAGFVTYRYYLSNRLAIGFCAGLDNQKGNLSYGPPHTSGYSIVGHSGSYKRNIYTLAPELLFIYNRLEKSMFYGVAGAGYTFGMVDYSFNASGERFFRYNTPLHEQRSHFNAQITPIGFRQTDKDKRFCIFFELGFGYKGLLCMGVAVRLGQTRRVSS